MKDIYILIPAYNPDERLEVLIEELGKYISREQIIVVNDGSINGFDFSKLNVKVVCHSVNMGKGEALKSGFAFITENFLSCKGIVTADCDMQHLPEDIIKICQNLDENPQNLYLGSRFTTKNNVPIKSKIGNNLISFIMKYFFKISLKDTQTGLRGIPYDFVRELLKLKHSDFSYETAMILLALKLKYKIVEVHINTIYIDGNIGTHFKPFKDSFKIFKSLIKGVK